MNVAIEVKGLKEFKKGLRQLEDGKEWAKALAAVNRTAAQKVAAMAKAKAIGLGGVHKHAAPAIRGYGTATGGAVGVPTGGKSHPEAPVAFWGAKGRSGWYAKPQYRASQKPQHPPWVGNSWEPGGSGGPYGINAALNDYLPQLERDYLASIEELAKAAYPE